MCSLVGGRQSRRVTHCSEPERVSPCSSQPKESATREAAGQPFSEDNQAFGGCPVISHQICVSLNWTDEVKPSSLTPASHMSAATHPSCSASRPAPAPRCCPLKERWAVQADPLHPRGRLLACALLSWWHDCLENTLAGGGRLSVSPSFCATRTLK